MGKLALSVVFLSFLGFVALLFTGNKLFLDSLEVDPTTIIDHPIPKFFEVEQSIRSQEGDILVGVNRKHQLRLHLVISNTAPQGEPLDIESMLKEAKRYRVSGGERPNFLVRYLAANIDPRRADVKERLLLQYAPGQNGERYPLVHLTAQKRKWFTATLLPITLKERNPAANMLIIASHPAKKLKNDDVLSALNALGVSLQESNPL
ncbi:hypothetical protein MRY87_07205 [bacterium]|nr:hypothetical protein [bacterium]